MQMQIIVLTLISYCFLSLNIANMSQNIGEKKLETGFYFVGDSETGIAMKYDNHSKSYFLIPESIITKIDFKNVEIREETWPGLKWTHSLTIWLNVKGSEKWEKATTKASKGRLDIAFVLDNEIITILGVFQPITTGAAGIFGEHLSKEDLISIKEKMTG